jgi:hypothetical protein
MTLRTRLLATALAVTLAAATTSGTGLAQARGGKDGVMQAGITVHGHWTIDVRNKDGSLASHSEFENALDPNGGASLLAGLLNGEYVSGFWYVILGGDPGPCALTDSNGPCSVVEASAPVPDPRFINTLHFANLVRTAPRGFGERPAGMLTLSGFVKVTNPSQGLAVTLVQTGAVACTGDTAPRSCVAPINGFGMTSHTLATPIPVVFDQIVQVKVTLSFS